MIKTYIYNGVEYKTERQVRRAVFDNERKALPKCSTVEEWAKYGVQLTEVEPVVTDEQLAQQVRAKRDSLLRASDYYMMSDYPSTYAGHELVKTYRQALRDITKQEGFPTEVVWPTKPSVL